MHKRWIDRAETALALAATFLAAALHFQFFRYAGGLWRDEVSCVELALLPDWPALWAGLAYDSFPAPFYFILRFWASAVGDSDTAFRLFGFSAGLLSLGSLWAWSRWMGLRAPVITLTLWAASPLMARTGDSIRPYGLGLAAFFLVYGLLWSWTLKPDRRRWIACCLMAFLSVQLLYQNAVLLAALCCGSAWVLRREPRRAKTVLLLGLACAATLIPYGAVLRETRAMTEVLRDPMAMQLLPSALLSALGDAHPVLVWVWLGLALTLYWAYTRVQENRTRFYFAAVVLACGGTGLLVFLRVASFEIQPRYFYPLLALGAISLDVLLDIPESSLDARLARLTTLSLALLIIFPGALRKIRVRQTNIDWLAARLEAEVKKNDLIVVNPWYNGVTFQRYYRGQAPWTTIPAIGPDLKLQRVDALKPLMAQKDPLRPVFDLVTQSLKSGGRVFIVGGVTMGRGAKEMPLAPAGPWGWYSGPYLYFWGLELSRFLHDHSTNIDLEPPRLRGAINPYEDLRLDLSWGWANNS